MYLQGVLNNKKICTETTKLHTAERAEIMCEFLFFNDDFECRLFTVKNVCLQILQLVGEAEPLLLEHIQDAHVLLLDGIPLHQLQVRLVDLVL